MKSQSHFFAIIFLSMLLFLSCQSSASKQGDQKDSTKDSLVKTIQAVKPKIDSAVVYEAIKAHENIKAAWREETAANDVEVSNLKIKINKEMKKVRAKDEERLDELQKRNDEMKKSIDEYKEKGEQDWENFKNKIDTDSKKLNQDLIDFGKKVEDAADIATGKKTK